MVFNTKFSLPSFLKQVKKLTDSQKDSIKRAGFGNLLRIPDHVLRRSQLIQLMEKWSCEKQAFIFPPGELKITVLDVSLILGLRVIGQRVVLKEGAPLTSLEKEYGASVSNRAVGIEVLKERLEALGEKDDESFIRVFLLYCFGTLLFPSANGKVDSRYLLLLQDVDGISSFAWGAAVLEELHNCLSQRISKKTSNIGGCLILLQIWCYEHIIVGRPKLLDCPSTFKLLDYPSTFPRACRWESSARHYLTSSQFNISFEELEHTQILWKLEPTSDEIEIDIIREIPQVWYLSTGPGTIEQPIEVQSERAIRPVRVRTEEVEEEDDPTRQEKSIIFVLSDDEESKVIRDEDEDEDEIKELKKKVQDDEELRKRVLCENEQLRKRIQDEEETRKRVQDENEELWKRVQDEEELRKGVQFENEQLRGRVQDDEELRKKVEYENEKLRKRVQDDEELRMRVEYENEELKKRVQDEEKLRKSVQDKNEELRKRVHDEEELRERVEDENEEVRERVQKENEELRKRVHDEVEIRKRVQDENIELRKRVEDEQELKKIVEDQNEKLCEENKLMERSILELERLLLNDSVDL